MNKFDNVAIEKLANLYFDGQVSSRTVTFPNDEKKTLGIMMPGQYTFETAKKELMEIQAGEVKVRIAAGTNWTRYCAGSNFEVSANSKFDIEVLEVTDYCCSYFDD